VVFLKCYYGVSEAPFLTTLEIHPRKIVLAEFGVRRIQRRITEEEFDRVFHNLENVLALDPPPAPEYAADEQIWLGYNEAVVGVSPYRMPDEVLTFLELIDALFVHHLGEEYGFRLAEGIMRPSVT
jgi:hypothetical protein